MKKSSKISIYSFLAFLFFSLCEVNRWRFNFWFIRLSFILFISSFVAAFIFSSKKPSFEISKSLGLATIGYIVMTFLFISIGGIFFALLLGLALWPIVGPSQIINQGNYVIQRPYQGFLGSPNNLQFVERKLLILEKNIAYIQTRPEIEQFEYLENQNLLILKPSKDTINLNTSYQWK